MSIIEGETTHPGTAALDWVPLLLQTSDALFPTGAYAHSLGFEECVRLGLAHDEKTLCQFLQEQIVPVLTYFELPYLRFALEAAQKRDLPLLTALDGEIRATKLARETREASAQLGGRRLKALRVLLPEEELLIACEAAVRSGAMEAHQVIIYGVQAAVGGIPPEVALAAYFYQAVAAVGSAALKLIRIGQDGVQRAIYTANLEAGVSIHRSLTVLRDAAGWFSPLLEIASMRHEHSRERLFIS